MQFCPPPHFPWYQDVPVSAQNPPPYLDSLWSFYMIVINKNYASQISTDWNLELELIKCSTCRPFFSNQTNHLKLTPFTLSLKNHDASLPTSIRRLKQPLKMSTDRRNAWRLLSVLHQAVLLVGFSACTSLPGHQLYTRDIVFPPKATSLDYPPVTIMLFNSKPHYTFISKRLWLRVKLVQSS